ncbi:MAG: class I fructose-bisphosphate aldolase [Bacillota bacterium]
MAQNAAARRPSLADLDLPTGKKARLYRLLYKYGPANGTLLLLPIDQGLEHGPRDFFVNPDSADPEFQLRIAREGRYSGIVFHVGIAERYMRQWAGEVPLVLKINGKTEVPSDKAAFSSLTGSVEDAVRLGADAIGYTLYVGSPSQAEDIRQFNEVRREAERCGMPIIVWSYPRGEAVEARGGKDTVYAVDYAARVAAELGADVIKINLPQVNPEKLAMAPKPYNSLQMTPEEATAHVIRSAGKSLVIFAGGEMKSDADTVAKARMVMEAGASGLIFGRNIWQRKYEDALRITQEIHKMMADFPA